MLTLLISTMVLFSSLLIADEMPRSNPYWDGPQSTDTEVMELCMDQGNNAEDCNY